MTTSSTTVEGGRYRVGIDIGGTFTDFVLADQLLARTVVEKTPTTPRELWRGVMSGLERLGAPPATIAMIAHGTTVGLNCLLERKGKPTGLITTRGFRDVYEIARHNRTETYDLFYRKPQPLIPRRFRLEVRERLDPTGAVIEPLVEQDVRTCIAAFKVAGIASIAVCLLHAYASPVHEQRIGEILAAEYPEASVSLSHQLVRQWREYERTSTTVVNAYVRPVVGGYLDEVERQLQQAGHTRSFLVSQSSGGLMSVAAARSKPVHSIMSGPAGGAMAAAHLGRLAGQANVIAFDMGGTSTDVSLVQDGALKVTADSEIDRQPLLVATLDVKSIGAGGGSIASVDSVGALQVGPESAGAEPGPVCYGRGGTAPTVTDANLVLGRLHATHFLGGDMRLDTAAARRQVADVIATPLGLEPTAAAMGILRVVNTKMAYAVRAVTLERGLDPAGFTLLAFGGAGPMHALAVAGQLGIPEVIVPIGPGAFSALGMLVSDLRHDFARTFLTPATASAPVDALNRCFAELAGQARAVLAAEGVACDNMVLTRALDLRYVGQECTVSVPLAGDRLGAADLDELRRRFHELHERTYGHASAAEPTEIVNLRLTATGSLPRAQLAEIPRGTATPPAEAHLGEIAGHFDSSAAATPVLRREALLAGNRIDGPAVVVEKTATTVVEPRWRLTVMPQGHLSLRPIP